MNKLKKTNSYCRLAKAAIKTKLEKNKKLTPPEWLNNDILKQKKGCFVSLLTKDDNSLRGCIGTVKPKQNNLAEEIIANSISAAFNDPRFPPLKEEELNNLLIKVDILNQPEPISSIKELDPKKYGLIVASQKKQGLLLPDLDGVDTIEEQINIACQKAGITSEPEKLYRFEVQRFEEKKENH
jgi:hypothetical protein